MSSETAAALWDVIIIGGGPAGSSAATTLAQAGRKVLVLEKEKFPRFHVGESLLPYNRAVFEELGVWPKIAAAGFTVKRGAQFWMGNGSHHTRLDFMRGSFTKYPEAVQVERSKFDDLLLNHSRACGVEVREQCTVLEHRVHADHVSVKYRDAAQGGEHEVSARFLMDASGLGNFTGTREKVREYYAGHKKIAMFRHFSGVKMPEGEEAGDILIIRRENSWFWMIPLEADKVSVGLVVDRAEFQALSKKPLEAYEDAIRTTPTVAERFTLAQPGCELHVVSDFSYRNDTLVSPRVVRVGDASGFIDPIFSSGVLLATTSGRQGAQVVHEALNHGAAMTAGMRKYERDNRYRIAQYWEFIENFYKVHFAQMFFQPYNRFRMVCSVNAVLAGCTKLSFQAWWRLRVFFLLAHLNKYIPVVPRIPVD